MERGGLHDVVDGDADESVQGGGGRRGHHGLGEFYDQRYPQFDYDARWPTKDPEAFAKFSAVTFAEKVTTPLLVLHGAADLRVPAYQGREFFELLAALGKTTRMVTYPGSPHFPRVWEQRRDVFREIAAWLAKYNP
jgi:dipeptidyl aminopeptidase/acylaminoacyl peptidase